VNFSLIDYLDIRESNETIFNAQEIIAYNKRVKNYDPEEVGTV